MASSALATTSLLQHVIGGGAEHSRRPVSATPHNMDTREMDAVRALLDVSPAEQHPNGGDDNHHHRESPAAVHEERSSSTSVVDNDANQACAPAQEACAPPVITSSEPRLDTDPSNLTEQEEAINNTDEMPAPQQRRPRSGSFGLDALADLATMEKETVAADQALSSSATSTAAGGAGVAVSGGVSRLHSTSFATMSSNNNGPRVTSSSASASDSEDSATMPPPPPRYRRKRSASNPEGMEKWDSLSSGRRDFVLPASILEEELAEVSAAMQKHQSTSATTDNNNNKLSSFPMHQESIPEDEEFVDAEPTVAPASSPASPLVVKTPTEEGGAVHIAGGSNNKEEENLPPDELLRRARSRLLEDLLEGRMHGDKGGLVLPHSLDKYKEVYNKNGRIGIYTPAERAAIIAKFNRKRGRRVWNKKIRYNCRKSLADRRLRVKGRFVKRSEQEELAKKKKKKNTKRNVAFAGEEEMEGDNNDNGRTSEDNNVNKPDEKMPNVNDPEAGFSPTEDQPYRRLRRHTIT